MKNRVSRIWRLSMSMAALLSFLCTAGGPAIGEDTQGKAVEETNPDRVLEDADKLIEEGRYREAETMARKLLAVVEKEHGADSLEASRILDSLVRALWRGGKTKDPQSRVLAERAVRIKEKTLGPEHPEVALSLCNLAILLKAAGDYTGARTLYERALAIQEKALGPEHLDVAATLNSFGILLWKTGDYEQARPLYERALEIREKNLGPEHPLVAQCLNNLANLFREMGDYGEAKRLYERGLEIREKTLGPEHRDIARSLNSLGILLGKTGDYAGARPHFERALAIREKTYGSEHPLVATSLANLANLLWSMGDYARAKPLFERALAIREKTHGPDHPAVAGSLNNLANLLSDTGDYAGARQLYERSLAIEEKTLGPDHPHVVHSLNNLARLLWNTGDYAGASPLFEQALAISEKTLGPEHPLVAASLSNLGALLRETGDYAGAKPLSERALAIREKAHGADHLSTAYALNNLANLLSDTGDYAGARHLYERVLAIREKALGPEHPKVAISLNNLANLFRNTGDYWKAKPLHERALAIREKVDGPAHPDVALSLNNLAGLLFSMGDSSQAFDAALRSEEISRKHVSLTVRTISERQALRYAAVRTCGLDISLSFVSIHAAFLPSCIPRAWDTLIHSRALVLDEMAARHRTVGEARNAEVADLAKDLASARQRLANLTVRGLGSLSPERYRNLLDSARTEKEKAEQALAEKSVLFRQEQAKSRVGLEEVAASMPPESALVAFARYEQYQRSVEEPASESTGLEHPQESSPPTTSETVPSYLAFVLRPDRTDPSVIPLGSAEEIEALVSAWSQEAARGANARGRSPADPEDVYRKKGVELRQKIWDPIASRIGKATRVFVVPDGPIHLVNLAALPIGKASYLVETGPVIHYLSAERDLVPSSIPEKKGQGLLAMGGPAFDETTLFAALTPGLKKPKKEDPLNLPTLNLFRGARSDCGDFRSLQFKPLPGTEREVKEVISLWSRSARESKEVASAVLLKGAAASEKSFKQKASGKRVLHLATHGFFLGGRCESALEAKRGVSGLANLGEQPPPPIKGGNPLLLAGLALAGANRRDAASPEEEDGILTAEEIAALDLSGVEWAVLSACDTGVGEIKAGEGVFGLRRSFEVAGVGTLIMSLWPVEDKATREWMKALYEARLVHRMDTAEAVRDASLKMLKHRREKNQSTHPFYWGGFVAAGDWN
ncbi:tetratricopeptide repeat protein [Acidobacteriota bacterium]